MPRRYSRYKKYITEEEIFQILINIKTYKIKVIIQVLQYTGMRVGDAVKIKRSDILNDFEYIRVSEQKTGRTYDKPIPTKLRSVLKEYIRRTTFDYDNPYLFQPRTYVDKMMHITTAMVRWEFFHARIASGLNDYFFITKHGEKLRRISPHTIRHYFATQIYKKSGHDLLATKEMLGHKEAKTTEQFYIDPIDFTKKKELAELID